MVVVEDEVRDFEAASLAILFKKKAYCGFVDEDN